MRTPFTDPIINIIGTKSETQATGAVDDTTKMMAYVKAIYAARVAGSEVYFGTITTGGSATAWEIEGLAGLGDHFFYDSKWYAYMVYTTDQAAPIGEWRAISDYTETDGAFTSAAFSAVTTAGDQVYIVPSYIYDSITADALTVTTAAEVETTSLDTGDGSSAGFERAGSLLRHVADTIDLIPQDPALEGDQMDLVDAPNSTAIAAINAEEETSSLDGGGGAITNKARLGLVARYIGDTVTTIAANIVSAAGYLYNVTHTIPALIDKMGDDSSTVKDRFDDIDTAIGLLSGAEVETSSLDVGEGSILDNTRAGEIIRYIADNMPAGGGDATEDKQDTIISTIGALNDAAAEGAVTDADTAMAYIKQLVTAIQLIPTTAMRGTDSAFLAAVGGALNDAAAEGAVTDADTAMAYIKQLVTAIQLIPTTAMRGTDNAALASVLGALADAAAEGAVTEADTAMAYLKQLVTAIQLIPTTAMRGTDSAFLAAVGGALDTAAAYAVTTDKTVMAYIKGLVNAGIVVYGTVVDEAASANDFDTSLTEATNVHYRGATMMFLTGVLTGQCRTIQVYTGASKNCDFHSLINGVEWTEAPANGDAFVVLPGDGNSTLIAFYNLFTLVNAIPTTAMRGTDNAALASVLGALADAAATGAVTETDTVMAYTKQLVTSTNRALYSMDFWSASVEEISVDGDAGTLDLANDVVVADLPAGATIVRAIVMFKFRAIENTYAGVNKLNGATSANTSQVIQIDDAGNTGWLDCLNFVDDQFTLAASTREGGDILISNIDVAARVDGNDTYDFQWLLSRADQDDINFNDTQFGIRIWYSV